MAKLDGWLILYDTVPEHGYYDDAKDLAERLCDYEDIDASVTETLLAMRPGIIQRIKDWDIVRVISI